MNKVCHFFDGESHQFCNVMMPNTANKPRAKPISSFTLSRRKHIVKDGDREEEVREIESLCVLAMG
jgi:hypothetical protein